MTVKVTTFDEAKIQCIHHSGSDSHCGIYFLEKNETTITRLISKFVVSICKSHNITNMLSQSTSVGST